MRGMGRSQETCQRSPVIGPHCYCPPLSAGAAAESRSHFRFTYLSVALLGTNNRSSIGRPLRVPCRHLAGMNGMDGRRGLLH
jgi:hypothetical protein